MSLYYTLDKFISRTEVEEYIEQLITINNKLWKIEDNIRDCERNKKFDQALLDRDRAASGIFMQRAPTTRLSTVITLI